MNVVSPWILTSLLSLKNTTLKKDMIVFLLQILCLHHVVYEGKQGHTVDHNWDESLQKVTKYDVKFEDGSIIRNIHESKLTAIEALAKVRTTVAREMMPTHLLKRKKRRKW